MAYHYKPLKGLRGVQTDFSKFCFSWDSAGNDYQAHFLWIYKEDELNRPRMLKYAQCIDNYVQVSFQYNNVSLQEIKKIGFLIFLTDQQREPSRQELNEMRQHSEFLCYVCCGTGKINWKWVQQPQGMNLVIVSDKKVPEGILYYEYAYGNKSFQFEIPADIQCGENQFGNIYFPSLDQVPQLKSRERNLQLCFINSKAVTKMKPNDGNKGGNFLSKLARAIKK